ncbi:response regulator transcription factor [Breoghania sp. L-A4]|uniref:response regulator transcription factor n=1 Tax=Breoghania sp. L-A4 TaxID=2304600 RepID=UPI000E35AE52|nr:response regulator transcription factor [Breoghania sp. L-A4]AXS42154.1 DNA-binding response regulator [Breoghania sp. L-A4]
MRIAIIEDNKVLARGIGHRLRDQGHAVDILYLGEEGDAFLMEHGADVVILDINLPDLSGLDVLRRLRGRGDAVPVLLLTARAETSDRVAGLDLGADDYLVKPFEPDELEARLRALLRRRPSERPLYEEIGTLRFDRGARRLSSGETLVELPRRELAVLECLVDRRGRLVSKASLTDHVYGAGADVEDTVVEIYISRLRKRLEPFSVRIRTARGLGYLLENA